MAFTAPCREITARAAARRPDLPRSFDGLQYEAALQPAAREADLMEGPLNGQWRLVDASGGSSTPSS